MTPCPVSKRCVRERGLCAGEVCFFLKNIARVNPERLSLALGLGDFLIKTFFQNMGDGIDIPGVLSVVVCWLLLSSTGVRKLAIVDVGLMRLVYYPCPRP
jgi:hypothetical protein